MHILDLDLDFFLNDVEYMRADDCKRLSSEYYKPWSASRVRHFLEQKCGLSTTTPLEGRIVDHHDEAFDFWRQLIESDRLTTPFEITHVDSHSDLGLGDSSYCYLMAELLQKAPDLRLSMLDRNQVQFGNYLAFAIACRWVNSIYWINHPSSADDLPSQYFNSLNRRSGIIQLRSVDSHAFDTFTGKPFSFNYPPGLRFEPEVPFQIRSWRTFKNTKPFSYVVLSKSPGFTPVDSDQLIPVIAEYIRQI